MMRMHAYGRRIQIDITEADQWLKNLPLVEVMHIAKKSDEDIKDILIDKLEDSVIIEAYEEYLEDCFMDYKENYNS